MAEFPQEDVLFNSDVSWLAAQAMPLAKAWFDVTKQLSGGQPATTTPILDGAISPDRKYIIVDTEGQAPNDELDVLNIDKSNDGMEVWLRSADSGRIVTLKHSTGLYGAQLTKGQDVELSATSWLALRRNGDHWFETTLLSVPLQDLPLATPTTPGIVKPDGKSTFVDATGALSAAGVPMLSISWELCTAALPGKLNLSLDNGLIPRNAFSEAWAEIAATRADLILDDAAWLAEVAAQGSCAKFSSGDGATTFRVPLLRRVYTRAADPVSGLATGTWQGDAIRNIAGKTGLSMNSSSAAVTPPFKNPTNRPSEYVLFGQQFANGTQPLLFDASLSVPTANENRPVSVALTPYMQMYGSATEAGEANIAALVQASVAKLDTATWEQSRVKTWVSDEYDLTFGTKVVINHGLNLSNPNNAIAEACIVCKVAEGGYSVGQKVRNPTSNVGVNYSGAQIQIPFILGKNTLTFNTGIGTVYLPNLNTGAQFLPTAANWRWMYMIHYNLGE